MARLLARSSSRQFYCNFLGACSFSAASRRSRSELQSKTPSPPASPPSLIDSFVTRAQLRQAEICDGLARKGWACVDGFMGDDACVTMRNEAESLLRVST